MLRLIAALLLLSLSSSIFIDEEDASRTGYQLWCKQHGKQESEERFLKYRASIERIKEINEMNLGWRAGATKFSDMSQEEFQSTVLMRPVSVLDLDRTKKLKLSAEQKSRKPVVDNKDDAASFDWNDLGAVTPVKDQGFVGTCWSFSTVGNVEGQYFLSTNISLPLSEEYLVDCDGSSDYDLNHADCSVFGGWPYLAYQFIMQQGGIPSSADVPYCAGTGDCYPCMKGPEKLCGPPPYYCDRERDISVCASSEKSAKISDWGYIGSDEDALIDTLQQVGPLSALLDATQLQYYKSGVWTGAAKPASSGKLLSCSDDYLNHAILITGFGVDEETGLPFYSVKNSWGAAFGENGYFRILRGSGECGINTAITSSIV